VTVRAGAYFACRRQLVRIGKRETSRAVIKSGGVPGNGVVARGASSHRESVGCRRVFGIRSLLPSGQVTLGISAIRGGDLQLVVPADVAVLARNIRVPVGQRKIDRRRGVIDPCGSQPTVKTVASLAGLRKLCGDVIGIGRLLKIRLVAGNASGGKSLVLPDRRTLVAVIALHGGVSAKERETVLVILELLDGDVPALDGVTLSAVGAHLAIVNVGVAILAVLPDIRENRFDVTLRALHVFVHAAEGVFGFAMIKLGISANGAPTGGGVAVFARDGESAVRTFSGPLLRRLSG
jgi:hypothetical protein